MKNWTVYIISGPDPHDFIRTAYVLMDYAHSSLAWMTKMIECKCSCSGYYRSECEERCSCNFNLPHRLAIGEVAWRARLAPLFRPAPGYYIAANDVITGGIPKPDTTLIIVGRLACIALRDKRLQRAYSAAGDRARIIFYPPFECIKRYGDRWEGIEAAEIVAWWPMARERLDKHLLYMAYISLRYAISTEKGFIEMNNLLDERSTRVDPLETGRKAIETLLYGVVQKYHGEATKMIEKIALEKLEEVKDGNIKVYEAKVGLEEIPLLAPVAKNLARRDAKPVAIIARGTQNLLVIGSNGEPSACTIAKRMEEEGLIIQRLADCGKQVFEGIVEVYGKPEDFTLVRIT